MAWSADIKVAVLDSLRAGSPGSVNFRNYGVPIRTQENWAVKAQLVMPPEPTKAAENGGSARARKPAVERPPLAPDVAALARKALLLRLRYLAGEDKNGNDVPVEMGSLKTKALAYEVRTLSESLGSVLEATGNDGKSSDSSVDDERVLQSMGLDVSGAEE